MVQLPHLPITQRPQSARDEFWRQRGTSGAIDACRQLSNHKRGRRKKALSLPGGKLQPLFKNNTAPADLDKLGSSKHAVLPHISSKEDDITGMERIPSTGPPCMVRIYMAALRSDMSLEQAAIMKHSVPQIQEFCSSLGLPFQLVDLTWGIGGTSTLSHARTLREREIEQCKQLSVGPHFVALVGDSLGIGEPPQSISTEEHTLLHTALQEAGDTQIVDIFTSAYQHSQPDAYSLQASGITESEQEQLMTAICSAVQQAKEQDSISEERANQFLHTALSWDVETGVFLEQHPRRRCLCYQREVTGLPADHPIDHSLTQLRQRLTDQLGINNNRPFYLKAAQNGMRPSPDDEQYQSYLKKLTEMFTADVIELIRQDMELLGLHSPPKPSVQRQNELQAEISLHARLGLERSKHFVGQTQVLERLKSALKDPKHSSMLVVYGPSGSGKTALMGRLAHKLIKEWFSSECVVVHRVLGATSQSSGIYSTVTSIVLQLCREYNVPLILPQNSSSIGSSADNTDRESVTCSAFSTLYSTLCTFRDVVERIAREKAFVRPMFILLDGINNLQPHDESLRALWAITNLPPNVHVIVSTLPSIGRINLIGALQTLITDSTAELEPLLEAEARDLVQGLLQETQHTLTDAQIDKIITEYRKNEDTNPLQPLSLVAFTRRALGWNASMSDADLQLPQNAKQQLSAKLDELENRYGQNLVTLLCAYITCMSVGIHERDLQDLLSMNGDIMEEVHSLYGPAPEDVDQVPIGIIISMKHELQDFIEEHSAYGQPVLAWRHRDYYELAADKYQVIFPGIDDELISEESTSFTLMLHEYMANLYLQETSEEEEEDVKKTIISPQPLIPENRSKLMRIPLHMKVLLPVEGVQRAKTCTVFNFQWLRTKLESVPAYVVLQDIYALIVLTQHLLQEGVLADGADRLKDMEVLYECLQLAYPALARSPSALAAQLIGRLSGGGLRKKYTMIDSLLQQIDDEKMKAADTSRSLLLPVHQCFPPPGGQVRHTFTGPTHLINFLSAENVAVMFSQKTGCDVWRVSTGELLHRFPVNPEQALRGVVTGHVGEFIIVGHYSHLKHKMELRVWSTETGIELHKADFPYKFDVFVVSADDQMIIFATTIEETEGQSQHVLLAINMESRDVAYAIPLNEVHTDDSVSELIIVDEEGTNIGGVTKGLVSVGGRSSKDLAFWDLSKQEKVFVTGLQCYASMVKVHASRAIAVCASLESSTIVVVDLTHGKVQHSIHGSSLRNMNDILLTTDGAHCLVATQSNGVVIYSMDTAAQVKSIILPDVNGVTAMPTKLLLDPDEQFLLAGQSNGNIQILLEETGELLHVLHSHTDAINSLCLNSKGQLFSAGDDGSAHVWNGESIMRKCHKSLAVPGTEEEVINEPPADDQEKEEEDSPIIDEVTALLLMPNGKEVITASQPGLKIWSIEDGSLLRDICGEVGVQSLMAAYKGKLLLTSATQGGGGALLLKAWRMDTGAALPFTDTTAQDGGIVVYCFTLFPSQDKLLVLSPHTSEQQSGINVSIYDLFSMSCVSSMHCNITGNMDSTNLRFLGLSQASAHHAPSPELMLPGDATMVEIEATDLPPNRLHDKQRRLRYNNDDEGNTDPPKLYAVLDYFPNMRQSFFFTFVVSGSELTSVSMDAYEPMHMDTMSPQCAVLLPRGARCITGSVDGNVVEWDVTKQEVVKYFADRSIGKKRRGKDDKTRLAHAGSVTCLCVQDDVLVSGGMEGTLKLWMINTGKLIRTVSLHTHHMISSISLTDGMIGAAGCTDGRLALIDLSSGSVLSTFDAGQPIQSIYLTSAGKHVLITTGGEEEIQQHLIILSSGGH